MIRGGVGGGKTKVGLKFESRVDIRKVFEKAPHYAVKENVVYFNDQKVAQLFQKHKLYKDLLEKNGIDYSTLISKSYYRMMRYLFWVIKLYLSLR